MLKTKVGAASLFELKTTPIEKTRINAGDQVSDTNHTDLIL
ncbi:hypothetical protein ACQCVP_21000 [Rossellomorea vietnamensis]